MKKYSILPYSSIHHLPGTFGWSGFCSMHNYCLSIEQTYPGDPSSRAKWSVHIQTVNYWYRWLALCDKCKERLIKNVDS